MQQGKVAMDSCGHQIMVVTVSCFPAGLPDSPTHRLSTPPGPKRNHDTPCVKSHTCSRRPHVPPDTQQPSPIRPTLSSHNLPAILQNTMPCLRVFLHLSNTFMFFMLEPKRRLSPKPFWLLTLGSAMLLSLEIFTARWAFFYQAIVSDIELTVRGSSPFPPRLYRPWR